MKRQKSLMLVLMVLCTFAVLSCQKTTAIVEITNDKYKIKSAKSVVGHPAGLQTNLRMYGYYSIWGGSWEQQMDSVNINQLTDVCISFINPNSSGVFTISNDIAQAVVKGHNQNVKMHFSFGGGGGPAYWDNLIKSANRAQVISNIRKVLTDYDFDGVDVDLENERITTDYNGFVVQLSDTLRLYNKVLSAALSSYQRNQLSAEVYSRLDFLNVMCYDYTKSTPQSHSSFAQFQTDFNNFKAKLPAAKINMGVPGYAWEYNGNTATTQVSYKSIVNQFPTAGVLNYKYATSTKTWWFDGFPVLRQKVAYCLQQGAGGMMMWQIMHDPKDDATSLLKLMNYCAANPASAGFNPTLNYSLRALNSYYAMEVANGSLINGTGIQQNPWIADNKQRWSLTANNNEFKIANLNSGKVLDEVDETPSGNGTQFIQNDWHGGGNQRYKLVPNELGYYKIVNVASNRLATVDQASTTGGAKIVQSNDVNGTNQQWLIINQ